MTEKPRLYPGPDHPITVTPTGKRVVVTAGGRVVADTRDALTLQEASYPAVQYVPLADVDRSLLERTGTESYCPFKGEASYYTLAVNGAENADAAWYYPDPKPRAVTVKDRVAFWNGVEITA